MKRDLPRDDSAFFGRRAEIDDVHARLGRGARLVTIVGLGGIGKTRLAVEAARRLDREALFVSLTEARKLEAAVRAVGKALGTRVAAESKSAAAADAVGDALAKRGSVLLVLDGLEGLGGAAGELVDALLDKADKAQILATSREPLGVRGEEKLVLAPLDADSAKALFLDRARAASGKDVAVEEGELASIVEKVDRLPLALELAASRLEVLAPAELLARLGARLDVLADPSQKATMRATLDASWELLDHDEREVLAQATVFAGAFGIEAAEDVLLVPGPGRPDAPELLDVLESLLRKSLVVRAESSDRARLRLYETVRTWARAKLEASGGADEARARHVRHHLAEAERLAASAYGSGAVRALDGLAEMLPELLGAFAWAKDTDPRSAARVVLALTDLLLFRGLFELRAELFAAGAEAAERAGDRRLLARALVSKARVTLEVGNMSDAEAELLRARELARAEGDEVTVSEATRSLGWLFTATTRFDDAEKALADALAMHRALGSARGEADARVATGILAAFTGRRDEARKHLGAALSIHVETGDTIRQEKVLGFAQLVGLDPKEVARGLPREVLARAPSASLELLPPFVADAVKGHEETGQRWREAIDLYAAGVAAHDRGEPHAAVPLFERALSALSRAGVTRGIGTILAHTAAALAETGDLEEAEARLVKAEEASRSEPGGERVVDVLGAAVGAMRARTSPDPDQHLAICRRVLERAEQSEGAPPELVAARRTLARAIAIAQKPSAPASARATRGLIVGPEARWVIPPGGERVDLLRYGPVRRLLERLVVERIEKPGDALSAEALIEAGWPGERMRHTAGLLRVYSAIRRLRRLGLDAVLVTRDDGYLLDANAAVTRDDA